jgi:hypothetical protein
MVKFRLFALFLVILSAFCGQALATNYYVDAATTEGNLVGDGSSGNPWQTISYALTQITTDDVLTVAAGTYNNTMTGSQETFPLTVSDRIRIAGSGVVTIEGDGSNDLFRLVDGAVLERLRLKSNGSGKGIVILGSSNEVRSCAIYGFSYGVYLNGIAGSVTVESSTLVKNTRGIDCLSGAISARNNIVAFGVGSSVGLSGAVTSTYNCLYSNNTNWSGTTSGEGDLIADPQFTSLEARDLYLKFRSPAVDKGSGEADPDGTRKDLGAYYRDQTYDPPQVTLAYPNGGNKLKGGSSYEVTWAATQAAVGIDRVVIAYTSGDAYVAVTTEANDGSYVWTLPVISTTEAKVKITAVSTWEVPGTAESASKFTIDSTGPSAPTLLTPLDGTVTRETTPRLTWEAATDLLSAVVSYEIRLNNGLITQDASTFYVVSPALTDGLHSWEVRAKDEVGNWGSYSSKYTFTVKTAPPTFDRIIVTDRTTGSTLETNERSVSVEVVNAAGGPYEMIAAENPTFSGAIWLPYAAHFTGNFTSPGDGAKTVYLKLRDSVGNISVTKEASIYLDTTGPLVTVESPAGGEKWAGGGTRSVVFRVTDVSSLAAGSLTIGYTLSGGSLDLITQEAAVASPYTWNIPTTINSAQVKVRVVIRDRLGNTGTGESAAVFTIDSLPPLITVDAPTAASKWAGGTTKNVTWRATDNFNLVADSLNLYYATGETFTPIVLGMSNLGSYPWPLPSVNTSEARVRITASDECGNIGTRESPAFIIDITPPGTPALLTPGNGTTTNDATPYFSWTAPTDNLSGIASYEIHLDALLITREATVTTYESGTLAPGLHTWEVRAQDGAGWWGNYSSRWTFTIKTSQPTVTSISLKDLLRGSTTETNVRTVSLEALGVSSDADQMIVSESATFNGASWSAFRNPATFELSSGDAIKTVRYKVRDIALNESVTREATIRLDTTPPLVNVLLPNGGERVAGGALYTVTWTATDPGGSGIKTNGITLRLSTDGGLSWGLIASNEVNIGSHVWTVPTGIDSSFCRISVEAEDRATNVGTDQSSGNFTIVANGPAAPSLVAPTDQRYLNTATPTLEWSAATGAVLYGVYLDTGEVATRSVTYYRPNTGLSEGEHNWAVRSRNDVLLWGAYSSANRFTVDLTAPAAIFSAFLDNANPLPTFEGRVTDNFKLASAEVRLDRGAWVPAALSGQTSAETFSYQVATALTRGAHTIEARGYDAAGNVTAGSNVALLYFDIVKATATVQTTVVGETLAAGKVIPARPTFTVSVSSPLTIVELKVSVDGTVIYLSDEQFKNKTITVVPAADLAAGKHTLQIEARNAFGDTTTTAYANLTVIADVRVSAASTATSVTFAIEASANGPALFVLRRPGRETIFQKPIDDLATTRSVTVDRYVAGEHLKGPYVWKMIYNNGRSAQSGGFIVP